MKISFKKIVLSIFFQYFFFAAICQNIVLKGLVADSISHQPIGEVSISVQNKDGIVIKSYQSKADGSFSFDVNPATASAIIFNSLQYLSKKIYLSNIESSTNDWGIILLATKPTSLEEVVVKGKRAPLSFKVDRQVFKASTYTNARNGTGLDLVRNLPSISVNGQGEISFRGSTSFLVLINGKPTQGEPSFVLSQLVASTIENIEVITSPSAAYDADGKAGIINIVTISGVDNGWMLKANVMGGAAPINDYDNRRNPQRYSMDLSTAYKTNQWDISAGFNYLRSDIAGFREGDVYTIIGNNKTSLPSAGERSFKRYNYGVKIGVSFLADKKNTFNAGFYSGIKYQSRVADLDYNIGTENIVTGYKSNFKFFNENDQQKKGNFTLANLDWAHSFSDKSNIYFSALYEYAGLSGSTSNNNILSRGSNDTLQYTINPYTNPLNAFRLKTDYSKKIRNGNLQSGLQYRYDSQDGDFQYLTKIIGTSLYSTNLDYSSKVKVVNQITAAYVQYSGTAKALNYSGGLRVEHSDRQLSFSNTNEIKNQKLTNLFPSLQFRLTTLNKGAVKLGYNRRVRRTNNFELNPLPEREHSETLEQGDPNLLPELIGTYEIGFEKNYKKSNWYATLYYQSVQNPIQRVNKVFNDSILNRVFTNAGMAKQLGIESNFNWPINQWWSSMIGGNLYQYSVTGKIFNGQVAVNNSSWVYSFTSTQSFSLPKNWSMQLSINYLSEKVTAQGKDSRFLTPHFTVKKISADKKWSFQMQWLNIDAGFKQSNRQRITTYGKDFYTTTNYIYETDQFQFSIGYSVAKKNRKINLPTSEMAEKEF
ncbi:MAG: TonB-dependent receptor [Chitinophagia bacterium]|nr:TonB-dependent receptor [Chitinophagia bacterium]